VLRQVAEGVLVHESEFCQSNAVVVQGRAGVLLIDAGVLGDEMAAIADDLHGLGIAEQMSWDLFGLVTALPAEAERIPWDGPEARIIEHQAHAPGHAALLIEELGLLVAGDMLSDVLIPMLDLDGTADPIEDYLAALRLLEGAAGDAGVLVPGHGSVGGAGQARARIDQDRAYVRALRDGHDPGDPRVGPSAAPGWEWVGGVHAGQLQRLASHRR
jgi:glyoxylase-like metal-dependent hydrolase (beta-lactamase superfamily II)